MKHLVRAGECVASIAARYGMTEDDLSSLGDNGRFSRDGRDARILQPGDSIDVPEQRRSTASFSSGGTQRYRVTIPTVELAIRLADRRGEAVANKRYELSTPGRTKSGQTDGDGWLRETVPAIEIRATLKLFMTEGDERPYETEIAIGAVDPDEDEPGIVHRLSNLGYGTAEHDRAALTRAIRSFQRNEGLEPTGEVDQRTRDRLRERHGS